MDMTSNRIAIVTGGGRGLGRAMVLGLAEAGIFVVATAAREKAEIEAVAKEARDLTGKDLVVPMIADVTRDEDCANVVDGAIHRFGRVDILVNNAGRGMKYVSDDFLTDPTCFWKTSVDTWRMVIDTNVNGPFLMARRVAPVMIEAGWGRIINVTMNHCTMRRRGFSPYGPSKAALESETIIWAQDLANTGVTVNALMPGGASMTGMIPDSVSDDLKSKLLDPAIMTQPLVWLSSSASDGVTGKRFDASKWRTDLEPADAARDAIDQAGW